MNNPKTSFGGGGVVKTQARDHLERVVRSQKTAVDCLLNLVYCDDDKLYKQEAREWLEKHGFFKDGRPTAKARNKEAHFLRPNGADERPAPARKS